MIYKRSWPITRVALPTTAGGCVANVIEKLILPFGNITAQIVATQSAAPVLEGYCGIATPFSIPPKLLSSANRERDLEQDLSGNSCRNSLLEAVSLAFAYFSPSFNVP